MTPRERCLTWLAVAIITAATLTVAGTVGGLAAYAVWWWQQ